MSTVSPHCYSAAVTGKWAQTRDKGHWTSNSVYTTALASAGRDFSNAEIIWDKPGFPRGLERARPPPRQRVGLEAQRPLLCLQGCSAGLGRSLGVISLCLLQTSVTPRETI